MSSNALHGDIGMLLNTKLHSNVVMYSNVDWIARLLENAKEAHKLSEQLKGKIFF